ncbi:DNA cytosine methyltransferase [Lonepinella sp. BR2357]|uniref:DNA cytosine methyltransferase n=1 Tax=Lonepinella sp. BR2357 TaxID=3434549 RepID=UPI003F6DE1F9
MTKDNKLTYISLFSSAGVGCYGFKLNQFECIATNEIIARRLSIQKLNHKCQYETGYICGDIIQAETKQQIYTEIQRWYELGNDRVDVLVATPPCQGMSVANHKKADDEIKRNSLVVESIDLIKIIKPRFFVLENVQAFLKTGCVNQQGEVVAIGDLIVNELGLNYRIAHKIINFKNHGANSSRTRTLVIGVSKELDIDPEHLFPKAENEKTLFELIGKMKSLDWGEYDADDFYHSFRIYPEHMRAWIKDIKQGQSAFDNADLHKQPHKIVNGKIVLNHSKNGDKYTRQYYDKVAPCIHTRNDQLASQNTVHPIDDRVFSIRELMILMNIPESFQWSNNSLAELNALSLDNKRKHSKKTEMNIRQSIGEAVPTIIFERIANNIKTQIGMSND